MCIKDEKEKTIQMINYEKAHKLRYDIATESDLELAFKLFIECAKNGNTEAQYEAALMLLNGYGVSKDECAFERWAIEAYENGHAGVLYQLAHYHRNSDSKMKADFEGEKFINHIELAYSEFEELANAGLLEAQEILGAMYRTGEGFGIAPQREKAIYWYNIAASNGSEQAEKILKYMEEHPEDAVLEY